MSTLGLYKIFFFLFADHYISVLQCQFRCEKKLSVLYKEYLPDYVGQHYNYLQYAYYKSKLSPLIFCFLCLNFVYYLIFFLNM